MIDATVMPRGRRSRRWRWLVIQHHPVPGYGADGVGEVVWGYWRKRAALDEATLLQQFHVGLALATGSGVACTFSVRRCK